MASFSDVPPAPIFEDRTESVLQVGFCRPEGATFSHVQMRDGGEKEGGEDAGEGWTTLAAKFSGLVLRKKNLVDGQSYHFRVRHRDNIDYTGPWSSASEAMIVEPSAGGAFVSPTPRSGSSVGAEVGSVSVEWDRVEGCKYEVLMRSTTDNGGTDNGGFVKIGTVQNPSVRKRNLPHSPTDGYAFIVNCVFDGEEKKAAHGRSSAVLRAKPPVSEFVEKSFGKEMVAKKAGQR